MCHNVDYFAFFVKSEGNFIYLYIIQLFPDYLEWQKRKAKAKAKAPLKKAS